MRRQLTVTTAILLATASIIAMWCMLPESAWARAGGGGGFGGGGGGGGGSGGGGGGGELIFWLFYLCIHHPYIGIPLAGLLIAAMVYGGNATQSVRMSRTIRRGRAIQHESAQQQALDAILAHDPEFETEAFLARVSQAFVKIQHAWSQQDLGPVRPFMSDGIHERFALYLAMQKADGHRNEMIDVRVHNADVAALSSDDHFDTIHVRFDASAADFDVDLQSGRTTRGSKTPSQFVEYWSFHRRPGAKSLSGPGAMEGNCPNCAAPLEIVDRAKCSSCNSTVNSGEYDWVLAEITQDGEWRIPEPNSRVSGLEELQEADPAFSIQHVEDRASVMFWKLIAAQYFNDAGYAAPILSERFTKPWQADFRRKTGEVWKEPAVGKVELIDVTTGSAGEMDRLRAVVRWSGIRCKRNSKGRLTVIRDKTIYTSLYVLVRQNGIRSLEEQVFSSSACTQCGGPIAVSQSAECGFCGALLTDGRYGWVLDAIEPYTATLAFDRSDAPERVNGASFEEAFSDRSDHQLSLAVLAKVMRIDGQLDEKELDALKDLADRRNIPDEQLQAAINASAGSDVKLPVPTDSVQATSYLKQLVRAGLADGKICRSEKRLLMRVAERTNLAPADLRMMIASERKREYQQARTVLRDRKQSPRERRANTSL